MNLEFLGHGGWLADALGDCLLIDPLLNRRFGRSLAHAFVKTAHADLDARTRQAVRAVVLTTDHFQRCDWASLAALPAGTRVFVSEHFADAMRRFLDRLGLEVVACRCGETVTHGRFEFVFVPGDADALPWDSRVCSLMLQQGDRDHPVPQAGASVHAQAPALALVPGHGRSGRDRPSPGLRSPAPSPESWCFFQSDTRIHRRVGDFRPPHWPLRPAVVALTCHYREYAAHGHSPWDSLLHERRLFDDASSALDFARTVFPVGIAPLDIARQYLLCGGDYERLGRPLPPAVRDKADLCAMVAPMLVNASCAVATVGRRYACLDHASGGVPGGSELSRHSHACRDVAGHRWPSARTAAVVERIVSSSSGGDPDERSGDVDARAVAASPFQTTSERRAFTPRQDAHVARALAHLAIALLLSDCGKRLLFTNEHLGRPVGPRRLALKLLNGDAAERYEFCFAHAAFLPSALCDDELLELPAGLVIDRSALLDVWLGTVSAVEAFSYNAVQWYAGSVAESPLGMVYLAFSPFAWAPGDAEASALDGDAHHGWTTAGALAPAAGGVRA